MGSNTSISDLVLLFELFFLLLFFCQHFVNIFSDMLSFLPVNLHLLSNVYFKGLKLSSLNF